jgi:hypothetical protein
MPGKVKESRRRLRLFHFSEDGAIPEFVPRQPRILPQRPAGLDWLNDPLVWAIEDAFQFLYLFPRECPRILAWPKAGSIELDQKVWMGPGRFRAVAWIEADWLVRLQSTVVFRYQLPASSFENLDDAGMWVSRFPVKPVQVSRLDDLPGRLADSGVDLRIVGSLLSIQMIWQSTLHVSGIRLRNARQP